MNRKISFAPGEFYHIYNRGTDKRIIFLDRADYNRFVWLLFFCNSQMKVEMRELAKLFSQGVTLGDMLEIRGETLVDIGAYCLMPNHFHILIFEKKGGGITNFLKKLATAYSMYFNKKYERTGKLFERAFLSQHVSSDNHLKYLFSYIHMNPAKIIKPNWRETGVVNHPEVKNFIEEYEFSSYRNYLGGDSGSEILNYQAFPEYFVNRSMKEEIDEWLNFSQGDTLGSGDKLIIRSV